LRSIYESLYSRLAQKFLPVTLRELSRFIAITVILKSIDNGFDLELWKILHRGSEKPSNIQDEDLTNNLRTSSPMNLNACDFKRQSFQGWKVNSLEISKAVENH